MSMDPHDFPATQMCDDLESTQNFGNTQHEQTQSEDKKKQVGVLTVHGSSEIEHPIYIGVNKIGRHSLNSIIIKDSTISKNHAEIKGGRKVSFIKDLQSCNGTLYKGQKMDPCTFYALSDGTNLRLGSVPATFREISCLNSSVLKTPAAPRGFEIIASTPESDFVDADNNSPRMSKLNIIRCKKGPAPVAKKVQAPVEEESKEEKGGPLKKRPLRATAEDSETSKGGKGKRLKLEGNQELEITTLPSKRASTCKDTEKKDEEPETSMGEPEEKNIHHTLEEPKPKPRGRGRGKKAEKKGDDEPKIDSPKNRRANKRTVSDPSTSLADDSAVSNDEAVPTSTTDNLKVPSKAKRAKNQTAKASKKEENFSGNEVEAPKTQRTNKRQANQSKEMISNTSSSFVESSFNESTSTTEKSKGTKPKKTATRGRKKKEVDDSESLIVDNSSASSSMLSLPESTSDANSSSASTPSRAKRGRASSPLKHKVLSTGLSGPSVKNYEKNLKSLGLSNTEDVKKCTVVVTDKVRRTFKFLCAVSRGIPIVSIDWLTDSARKKEIQDVGQFIVEDPENEAKFNFNLSESLQKAREEKMLAGFTVLITPNITAPPASELKGMVLASGGKAVVRPPAKWSANTVIISEENDLEIAKKYMEKAPKHVTLHSKEFLLTGILKQEVDLESYLLKIK